MEQEIPSELPKDRRLSLAHRELHEIPGPVARKFGPHTVELDLSGNYLVDLLPLREFTQLQALILDGNRITSHTRIPHLSHVHTLWVNRNKIDNLALFIDKVVEACPNVKVLSMLMNDACPNYFNGGTPAQYQDYRYYVINRLRNLVHLDDSRVSDDEKAAAIKKYGNLETLVARDDKEKRELEEKHKQREEQRRKLQEAEAKKRLQEEKQRRRARRHKVVENAEPPLPPGVEPKPPPPPPKSPNHAIVDNDIMKELSKRVSGIDLPDFDQNQTRSSEPEIDSYKWSSSDDENGGDDDDGEAWSREEDATTSKV